MASWWPRPISDTNEMDPSWPHGAIDISHTKGRMCSQPLESGFSFISSGFSAQLFHSSVPMPGPTVRPLPRPLRHTLRCATGRSCSLLWLNVCALQKSEC